MKSLSFSLVFPHFPNIETVECLFLRLTVKRHVFEGSLKPPPPLPPPPGFLLQSQFKTLSFERNSKIFRTKNRWKLNCQCGEWVGGGRGRTLVPDKGSSISYTPKKLIQFKRFSFFIKENSKILKIITFGGIFVLQIRNWSRFGCANVEAHFVLCNMSRGFMQIVGKYQVSLSLAILFHA